MFDNCKALNNVVNLEGHLKECFALFARMFSSVLERQLHNNSVLYGLDMAAKQSDSTLGSADMLTKMHIRTCDHLPESCDKPNNLSTKRSKTN